MLYNCKHCRNLTGLNVKILPKCYFKSQFLPFALAYLPLAAEQRHHFMTVHEKNNLKHNLIHVYSELNSTVFKEAYSQINVFTTESTAAVRDLRLQKLMLERIWSQLYPDIWSNT